LQNVEASVRQVREGGHPHIVACSDSYHLPRIRLMLALHGVKSVPSPRGAGGPSLGHWVAMSLRESLAIPYGLMRLLARRGRPAP
jgi:hypothetical protein